ncbi:Lipase 3 [Armadillidium vulgare]|nr:Lipase 3 [Armadillidium vulgare]
MYIQLPEIIQSFGYPAETHHVTTEDGYILELHRIPYGINGPSEEVRPVAFLQHGLLSSSFDWISDKPDRALGFLLADAGYDVWLNNIRGNTYSRKHTTLDPDWDEMGYYDVPAAIDYTLNTTGNSQLYYVGFNKTVVLLAPVVHNNHLKGGLRVFSNYSNDIDDIMSLLGHYEFLPSDEAMDYLANNFCLEDDITEPICSSFLFLISGYDPEEMNDEYIPIYLTHTPAGTSVHTVNHYGQLVYKEDFQKYDWGVIGNREHYGQDTPPLYNLQEPLPPVAFYWGQNDYMATPEDVARLSTEIQNLQVNHRVEWDMWAHLDMPWFVYIFYRNSAKESLRYLDSSIIRTM